MGGVPDKTLEEYGSVPAPTIAPIVPADADGEPAETTEDKTAPVAPTGDVVAEREQVI